MLEEVTAGNPCGPQKWMRQSLRGLQAQLVAIGVLISHSSVRRLLKQAGYSLTANRKAVASTQHPERAQQFRTISQVKAQFLQAGHPVISVDAKKKELIGSYFNAGQRWKQQPERVNDHDFPHDTTLKAVPYGIYDVLHNCGDVYLGTSGDTADFAVAAIERWYCRSDRPQFDDESQLLILCDAGGSNGYRVRNWKRQLQRLADDYELSVTVCHYPTGASKWNPIEHRLFSMISINWAGQPLRSLRQMAALIRGTTTTTGLQVNAAQLKGHFPTKVKVSDQQMAILNLERHQICPQWTYTIYPRHSSQTMEP